MYTSQFAAVVVAFLVTGCSIHPVPEDVTGVDTAGIVKQIRCETRDAARTIILKTLEDLATRVEDATAQSLFSEYTANPESMSAFNPDRSFPGPKFRQVRNYFNLVYAAAVAYTFDLTMNEQNDVGTTVNFLGPWQAKLTLGLTGNANRMRENERTFTITDKFSFLLRDLNTRQPNGQRYCDGHIALGPNYIYPIAGQIGIYNTVRTFFQLAIFENLAGDKAKPDGPAAMADKLTFTTTVDLIAAPKIVFAPVTTGFKVSDASLTGTLRRKDTHQVTVALALEPSGPVASLRGFVFSGAGPSGTRVAIGRAGGGQTLLLNRVTASTTSGAEQVAVYMIDQLKSKELQLIQTSSP